MAVLLPQFQYYRGASPMGDSREKALANIREAVELYIEDCRLSGDPVPEEDSLEYVDLLTGTRGSSCRPVFPDRSFVELLSGLASFTGGRREAT